MTITSATPETIGEIILRRSDMCPGEVRKQIDHESANGLCSYVFRYREPEIRFFNRPSEIIMRHARAHKTAMESVVETALEGSQEEVVAMPRPAVMAE